MERARQGQREKEREREREREREIRRSGETHSSLEPAPRWGLGRREKCKRTDDENDE
jgi:hypothetical protein